MEIKEINELDNILYDIKGEVIKMCEIDSLPVDNKIMIMNDFLNLCNSFDKLKESVKTYLNSFYGKKDN